MVVFKFRNLKTGQAMPIPEGEFLIGRADNAHVHVDDPSVSRNHARLLNHEEGFFIEDLGSSNGTALHGACLTARTRIHFGDILHIGSVPFRIDPEVTGQIEAKPPPSARGVSLASMSRDTERIPTRGETPWVPQSIPPGQLTAPEVNPADSDAEDLNAVTIREPEPAAPSARPTPQPAAGPARTATQSPVPKRTPTWVPVPTLQRSAAPQSQARQQPLLEAGERESSLRESESARPLAQENPDPMENRATEKSSGWIGRLVIFFAGLGAGLLLGLVFARIFFELGGKASGLP